MKRQAPWLLKLAAVGGLLYLHLPMAFIFLYAFTTEDKSYQFPPPGLTTEWFAVAWERQDIWRALWLSLRVALTATAIALLLGTLAALAMVRTRFFGKETVVHIKRGSAVPEPEAIAAALAKLKIACHGVRRDDSAML